jgi:hypothetical protein
MLSRMAIYERHDVVGSFCSSSRIASVCYAGIYVDMYGYVDMLNVSGTVGIFTCRNRWWSEMTPLWMVSCISASTLRISSDVDRGTWVCLPHTPAPSPLIRQLCSDLLSNFEILLQLNDDCLCFACSFDSQPISSNLDCPNCLYIQFILSFGLCSKHSSSSPSLCTRISAFL